MVLEVFPRWPVLIIVFLWLLSGEVPDVPVTERV